MNWDEVLLNVYLVYVMSICLSLCVCVCVCVCVCDTKTKGICRVCLNKIT